MHKIIYATVALAALGWSGSAWAVLHETTVTMTDNGQPLPEAKITLNRITDSEPPPEPKTEKTDESGKIVIVHDDKDKTSDSTIDIIVETSEGKTVTRRVLLREFLTRETIDVAVPFETEHAGESSQAAEVCADLTTLDDERLKIMLGNPELRERIVKLIEETEETEESETTTETKEEKATVSGPSKEKKKKAVQKKPKKQPTTTASQKKGPGAAAILGTGLSIGMGIAGSRSGHGGGHRDHMKRMD